MKFLKSEEGLRGAVLERSSVAGRGLGTLAPICFGAAGAGCASTLMGADSAAGFGAALAAAAGGAEIA